MTAPKSDNPFGRLADPLVATVLAASWLLLLLRFRLAPEIDLAVAGWFFDAEACAASVAPNGRSCGGFLYAESGFFGLIREILHPLAAILGIVMLIVVAVDIRKGRRWRNPGIRMKVVLLATLILGPGLIVNGILKAYWGRPRPRVTEDFGGTLPFVEAGSITDYCSANCSFVSGEAAAAGWLMCIALLFAVHRHRWAAIVVGAVSVFMAGLRVAFGAHYLSDAVLGFLMTVAIFSILAAISEARERRRA
ncbi:phosphatase PAP2 family protein [Oricola indica]|uniref:phosphatase PAP2 family protein n=1 Tax=Oricola indica TaxID=2872591 RepID=UPI001CBD27CE|nr:phosphatase PAP2 family protein [Oricola indica]